MFVPINHFPRVHLFAWLTSVTYLDVNYLKTEGQITFGKRNFAMKID